MKFEWNLVTFVSILIVIAQAQHRAGYHHHDPSFKLRLQNFNNKTNENSLKSKNLAEGPFGYIMLSVKARKDGPGEKTPKTTTEFGVSTARIQEIDTDELVNGKSVDDWTDNLMETNNFEAERLNVTSISVVKYMFGGYIRREIWAIPLISIILLNISLIIFFEIYVLCQSRSRNPLFLGQFLLFGLFLCSGLSLVFVISPSSLNCYIGRNGISISYSLIFSVLMVKSIFLISLDSGLNLPIVYQACLLLFSVLVQVAINIQSTLTFPPKFYHVNSSNASFWSECGTNFSQMLWPTVSYNAFLILLVGFLALKTRRIRENYKESTYIGFSILLTFPIWVSWILAICVLQGRELDACVAFGCQAQSLSTFLIMFMPKGRHLALLGDGGKLLDENQDDEYSPSFFHFKPGKYFKPAMIDQPTLSTLNPNVYFYRTDFHPGMIY